MGHRKRPETSRLVFCVEVEVWPLCGRRRQEAAAVKNAAGENEPVLDQATMSFLETEASSKPRNPSSS